jgi:hypothetical protein
VPAPARLGEELPVFCERCGYTLHGLPSNRCGGCGLLHHACPECGHHQPINTLRPAVQRILGRMRAWFLGLAVVARVLLLGAPLVAWVVVGTEFSYRWVWDPNAGGVAGGRGTGGPGMAGGAPVYRPFDLTARWSSVMGVAIFGAVYGALGRMMLLRWPRAWAVGLVLAILAAAALCGGAQWRQWLLEDTPGRLVPPPWTRDWLAFCSAAAGATALAGILAWPVWCGLVFLFLPAATARALLDWQSFRPASPDPSMGRD